MGKRRNPGVAISSLGWPFSLSIPHVFSPMAATWLASHFYVIEIVPGTDVPKKEDSMSNWVKHYYSVVDSMNVEEFTALHTEDVRLRFGNAGTVVGRDAVVHGITDFWG